VVRFVAVRFAATVAAVLILSAAFIGARALPWYPQVPYVVRDPICVGGCYHPSRPAWVLPSALVIGLVGLAAAAAVLAAPRRRLTPPQQPNALLNGRTPLP
jgi:hypothetical protein